MPAMRAPSQRSNSRSIREKTGCWTCRIRRKKCDQANRPDETNVHCCTTCARLRIECLGGFGERRARHLKNKVLIEQLKRLIKNHLNVNGLVKGIPRPRELSYGGPDILMLSVYLNSGVLPFGEAVDRGSPVSDTSGSSEEGLPCNPAFDVQPCPEVGQGCGVAFDSFSDMHRALPQSEPSSHSLSPVDTGVLLFPDAADHGSPFSDVSSSSEESTEWNPALFIQRWQEVEQEHSGLFDNFFDISGAVLPAELASESLDPWCIYQEDQTYSPS